MVEAQRACKASGKRLCHAGEWKNACRGPSKTRYPYGSKHVPHACVDTARTSPVRVLHGGVYNSKTMNDPRLNQLANTVEPTGSTPSCSNEFGVFDMVGNVHEWLDDGAFHGGYYLDTKLNREGCDYNTTAHAKSYYDYSTGFRCCADEGTLPTEPNKDDGGNSSDRFAKNGGEAPPKAISDKPRFRAWAEPGSNVPSDGSRHSVIDGADLSMAVRDSFLPAPRKG
jgi:hypothetical protein